MTNDVLVIGAGISGLAFAAHAARAGHDVRVLDEQETAGGCVATRGGPGDFWLELGAHTAYNSYGAFIEVLEMAGVAGQLQARDKPVLRFLDGDRLVPGTNLRALFGRMRVGELLRALPGAFRASPGGQSIRAHYSRLVGAGNYQRALAPMLTAVPCQPPDDLPADMLFKKRPRRKDVLRSFTLRGGLGTAISALARLPRVTVTTLSGVAKIDARGAGYRVITAGGERLEAATIALATPPSAAARLLAGVAPEAARLAATVREVSVDSLGVVVRAERITLPYSTFLIPISDSFYSVVMRDVVPDATWRGATLHFRPGMSREERLARAARLLGVARRDFEQVSERRHVMPSPVVGHAATIAALDGALAGTGIAVMGSWFEGLGLEDCALRARAEWQRVAALEAPARAA